jgi:hypothetical protein
MASAGDDTQASPVHGPPDLTRRIPVDPRHIGPVSFTR